MRKVPDGDLSLLVDGGQEGALVVDAEVEDAVLVGELEVGGEDGGVGVGRRGREKLQRETVERRQHGEFQLDDVGRGRDEGDKVVVVPLGKFNLERLRTVSLHPCRFS